MKFNLKLSLRKKKKVSLLSLHQKDNLPAKDWLVLLSIFSCFIVVSALLSAYLFFSVFNLGEGEVASSAPGVQKFTDTGKLQSAVDLINSKK